MDELEEKNWELMDKLTALGFLKTRSIIDAFKETPRHHFVLRGYQHYAYEDSPLPIVNSATISEPKTVAYMLELLQAKKGENILEIGTGSGWVACLLSRCVGDSGKVTTIEIEKEVFEFASKNIEKLKPKNVDNILGDGSIGYEKNAPYDKIIYSVAAPEIPIQVIKQLKVKGRLIAPVGTKTMQRMKIIDRVSDKKIEEKTGDPFQFTELKGELGF